MNLKETRYTTRLLFCILKGKQRKNKIKDQEDQTMTDKGDIYGVIDVGSNTIRLCIYNVT